MERNCLGVGGPLGRLADGPLPADILVPIPAAGRITNTRIESGVYKIVALEASARAGIAVRIDRAASSHSTS
jgi:hypothetical protein